MGIGRRGHRGGVDQSGEFVERSGRADFVLLRDLGGVGGVGVVNRGEVGRLRFGIEPRVIFPDMPDTNDSDAESFH